MEDNILTPDQVAQKIQVHPFTVLKFIKQGKLKASKLGRVYRIRESDVMQFLEDQAKPRQPQPSVQPGNTGPELPKKQITVKRAHSASAQEFGYADSEHSKKTSPLKAVSSISLPLESAMREEALQGSAQNISQFSEKNISTTSPSLSSQKQSTASIPVKSTNSTSSTPNSSSAVTSISTAQSTKKNLQNEDDDLLELDHYILD